MWGDLAHTHPAVHVDMDYSFMPHTATVWSRGGADVLRAAATLRKLCINILNSPGVLRYRRARVTKLDGVLPAEQLVHCGFSRSMYPDGEYWVMHTVDEQLLRAVVRELDLGISTAQGLAEAKRLPAEEKLAPLPASSPTPATPLGTPSAAIMRPGASAAPVAAIMRPGASATTAGAPTTELRRRLESAREAAPPMDRQLRARSAAHKLAAARPSQRGWRTARAVCSAVLALTLAWLGVAVVACRLPLYSVLLYMLGLPPPPLWPFIDASCGVLIALNLVCLGAWRVLYPPARWQPIADADGAEATKTTSLWLAARAAGAARAPAAAVARLAATMALLALVATAAQEEWCAEGFVPPHDWQQSAARLQLGLPACGASKQRVAATFRRAALVAHPDKATTPDALQLATRLVLMQATVADWRSWWGEEDAHETRFRRLREAHDALVAHTETSGGHAGGHAG